MLKDLTTVHITLLTALCAFGVAALALIIGCFLILHGTTGEVALQVTSKAVQVNFYSFVPGVAFALFGALIAWRALGVLIRRTP